MDLVDAEKASNAHLNDLQRWSKRGHMKRCVYCENGSSIDIRSGRQESLDAMDLIDAKVAPDAAHLGDLRISVIRCKMKRCPSFDVCDIDIRAGLKKSLNAMNAVDEEMAFNALTWTVSVCPS